MNGRFNEYKFNPRYITKEQFERLKNSIYKYGDLSCICYNIATHQIISGNQRSKVVDIEKCEIQIVERFEKPDPVGTLAYGYVLWEDIRLNYREVHWTLEQEKEANILANAAGGRWDKDKASTHWEFQELLDLGLEKVEMLGWEDRSKTSSQKANQDLQDAEIQDDRVQELIDYWKPQLGQVWKLRSREKRNFHLLIVGDCTDPQNLDDLMGGDLANGVFTSPPYAMQRKDQYGGIPEDEYVDWFRGVITAVEDHLDSKSSLFLNIKPHIEDGQRVLYVFDLILSMVKKWGWKFIDENVWTHQGFPTGDKKRHKNQFEPVYHFTKEFDIYFNPNTKEWSDNTYFGAESYEKRSGSPFNKNGRKSIKSDDQSVARVGNVIHIPNGGFDDNSKYHPATFPINLPAFFIQAYSRINDIWLDPFSGSGTTLIACENLKRQARAVELSPKYAALTLQRYYDTFNIKGQLITL